MRDVRDALMIARNTDGKLVHRPLSPHLQIYRWPISMALSILHRASGIALGVGTLLLTWWLVAAATSSRAFEVAQGFLISRVLERPLSCPLPVRERRLVLPRLGVVVGDQLRLGINRLRKALLEHLCNTLMVLLAGALEQRLIGCILDQGMLEEIRRLRGQPLLIEELRLHQLVQPML